MSCIQSSLIEQLFQLIQLGNIKNEAKIVGDWN